MNHGTELQMEWESGATEILAEKLGGTLIIAPHPDDESLGCGGTIAILTEKGIEVNIVFVSDGSMSHPNSKKYPEKKLALLRENEAMDALKILGVPQKNCTFLKLKDGSVPTMGQDGFHGAVDLMVKEIVKTRPQTILVPWQKDPHVDHRASWKIVDEALRKTNIKVGVKQYFIWIWALAKNGDLPHAPNTKWYKIDIQNVLHIKQKAIKAHVSQTSNLIDDDPEGFTLSYEILDYFKRPFEIFIESNV